MTVIATMKEDALWELVLSYPDPAFKTHLNYVECMCTLSEESDFTYRGKLSRIKLTKDTNQELTKKLSIIRLLKKNLDAEMEESKNNSDFAEIANIWVCVKAYYLIFNLQIVLAFFIESNDSFLKTDHRKIRRYFKDLIQSGKLVSNKKEFNLVIPIKEAESYKAEPGLNLRRECDPEDLVPSIMKKIVEYKLLNFKRENRIKDYKTKKNRKKRDEYYSKTNVNLIDFFYWYRIKTNYRDLDFLDKELTQQEYMAFLKKYYQLTINFYKSYKDIINFVGNKRIGKKII